MRNISLVLGRWGGWAAQDSNGIDYSSIAAGFKGLLPQRQQKRLICTDDDALIIESCLARLNKKSPYEYSLLVAHNLYCIPKRKIGKKLNKMRRQLGWRL